MDTWVYGYRVYFDKAMCTTVDGISIEAIQGEWIL